jgi:hypothetical protein
MPLGPYARSKMPRSGSQAGTWIDRGSHFPVTSGFGVTRPQRPMKHEPLVEQQPQVNQGPDVGASLRSVKYPFAELSFKPSLALVAKDLVIAEGPETTPLNTPRPLIPLSFLLRETRAAYYGIQSR